MAVRSEMMDGKDVFVNLYVGLLSGVEVSLLSRTNRQRRRHRSSSQIEYLERLRSNFTE